MKQVFPDIRPRRLGTRGHSRYCYAAMRKASKLQPPYLPDISSRSEASTSSSKSDEGSWSVVKTWSESLLGAQFESVEELAAHIQHNKHSPSTSKQILQRKIMQREAKDRKRNNVKPNSID
jgi:RFX DNA-binding domain